MQRIYYDGTDQEVHFKLTNSSNFIEYIGTGIAPDQLPGAIVQLVEYKENPVTLTSPVVTWNGTINYWIAIIPSSYITQFGGAFLVVNGTDILQETIELEVNHPETYYAGADALSDLSGAVGALDNRVSMLNDISTDEILNSTIESTYSLSQVLRIIAAVVAGTENRVGTTQAFTGLDGTTTRLSSTSTTSGRTVSSRDGT